MLTKIIVHFLAFSQSSESKQGVRYIPVDIGKETFKIIYGLCRNAHLWVEFSVFKFSQVGKKSSFYRWLLGDDLSSSGFSHTPLI